MWFRWRPRAVSAWRTGHTRPDCRCLQRACRAGVRPGLAFRLGFDIEAKAPEGTPKEQLNVMLQAPLEERFGLKVHPEGGTPLGDGYNFETWPSITTEQLASRNWLPGW